MKKENCFSAWSCDVKTGSVTETANNLSIRTQDGKTAGLVDVGTRYALLVNADQSVAVLDLKTGINPLLLLVSLLMEDQKCSPISLAQVFATIFLHRIKILSQLKLWV